MSEKESFYKYMSSDTALTVLRDFTLKFSSTSDFNDPFDYNPALSKIGFSKFTKRIGGKNGIRIRRKKAYKNFNLLSSEEFKRAASSKFSVTCFSKSPHIVPMWAHYADLHTGCVLGFCHASLSDLNRMFESSDWRWNVDTEYLIPQNVKYTETRPTLFNSEGITNLSENGWEACLIKAKAWEYEQEVRVIKTKPAGVYPFSKSQLRSVRFGLNVNQKIRKNIIEIVKNVKITHGINIKMFDVVIDHRDFKLNDIKC